MVRTNNRAAVVSSDLSLQDCRRQITLKPAISLQRARSYHVRKLRARCKLTAGFGVLMTDSFLPSIALLRKIVWSYSANFQNSRWLPYSLLEITVTDVNLTNTIAISRRRGWCSGETCLRSGASIQLLAHTGNSTSLSVYITQT